jgi:hypothetical protein
MIMVDRGVSIDAQATIAPSGKIAGEFNDRDGNAGD